MPILTGKLTAQIVKLLGPHGPDGVLAVFMFVGVISLIVLDVPPYAAGIFAILLFALYGVRKGKHEMHLERMAEANVRKMEAEIIKARDKHAQKLEKMRAALPPPDRGSNRNAAGSRRGNQK